MKIYSSILLTLLFLNFPLLAAKTDSIPKHYSCPKIQEKIIIDGLINEKVWKNVYWSDFFIDIEGDKNPKPYFDTRFKMTWDDSCLYIAAELMEEHIWATLTQRESVIFRDNDFEVFLDPDGDAVDYFEFEINAFGTEWDLFLNKPYSEKGSADNSWDIEGVRSAIHIDGTINDPSDKDVKWTLEIAIPWESFLEHTPENRPPNEGDTWRMNFSRVQWGTEIIDGKYVKMKDSLSGKNLPEHNWVWSPQGKINMHIPEKWGYVNFTGPATKPEFWIWIGADKNKSAVQWDSVFRKLNEAGFRGILMGADTSVLKKTIPIAKRYGLETHAWFWTMNRGDAKPEWLSVNRNGISLSEEKAYVNYYKFMCPALPEVKKFLTGKINMLASVPGLNGIHMDYIRYVDAVLPSGLQPKYGLKQDTIIPEFDFGYHPNMIKLFKDETGIDPLNSEDKHERQLWLDFRLNQLSKTVDTLTMIIKSHGLLATAAVFPTPAMSRVMVRQPWDDWHLDYYFPMVYHNFYEEDFDWITEVMRENKRIIGEKAKVICGLYLPALKNQGELSKAINAALEGGADGVALFDLNAMDDDMIGVLNHIRHIRTQKVLKYLDLRKNGHNHK